MAWLERIFLLSYERPRLLLAVLVLTVAAVPGIGRLRFETDLESMLSRTSAEFLAHERFVADFGGDNVSMIILEADDVFTPDRLRVIADVTEQLQNAAFTEKVVSLTSAFNIESALGVPSFVPLVISPPATSADAARIKAKAMSNPLIRNSLVSDDGATTAILLTTNELLTGDAALRSLSLLEGVVTQANEKFARVYHVGPPRFFSETQAAVSHDLPVLGVAAGGVVLVILFFSLRSPIAVLAPVVIGTIGLAWTFCFLGWTGLPITMLSAALPALVFVLGAGETTYLVSTFMQTEGAQSHTERLRATIKKAGMPCFLSMATTVAGFAVGGLFSVDLIKNFALTMSIGLLLEFLAMILILPHLLARMRISDSDRHEAFSKVFGAADKINSILQRLRPRVALTVIAASGLLSALLIGLAFDLRPSASALDMLGDDHPLTRDVERINASLGGTQTAYLVVSAKTRSAFRNEDAIAALRDIGAKAKNMPGFSGANSLYDMISYYHSAYLADPDADGQSAAINQDMIDEILFLAPKDALHGLVTEDYRKAVIALRHNIYDSRYLGDALAQLENAARVRFGDEFAIHTTGKSVLINRASERLVFNLLLSFIALVGVVSAAIAIVFRSWRAGALCVIPNALPAAAIFGLMPALGVPLNPGTALAAVVALGIAVNDTIHMFNKFRDEISRGETSGDSITTTIKSLALPLCATSFSLAAGFAVCALSSSAAVAQFGLLCSIAILLALPCDLFLTSLFLREFGERAFGRAD